MCMDDGDEDDMNDISLADKEFRGMGRIME